MSHQSHFTQYFWVDGQVVISDHLVSLDGIDKRLANAPCVDCSTQLTLGRYGSYNERGSWSPMPPEQFPKEFKTALLILGVT